MKIEQNYPTWILFKIKNVVQDYSSILLMSSTCNNFFSGKTYKKYSLRYLFTF